MSRNVTLRGLSKNVPPFGWMREIDVGTWDFRVNG